MNQLIPVVVVSDSGGASAAVYEYIEGAKKGTSARIPTAFAQPKQLGVLEAIAAAHRGSKGSTLKFFTLEDDSKRHSHSSNDLATFMLSTMINHKMYGCDGETSEKELEQAMILAIKWNAPHVIAPVIHKLGGHNRAGKTECVRKALQWALEMQRVDFIDFLLGLSGINAMMIDMLRIYTLPSELGYLTNDGVLQGELEKLFKLQMRRNATRGRFDTPLRNDERARRRKTIGHADTRKGMPSKALTASKEQGELNLERTATTLLAVTRMKAGALEHTTGETVAGHIRELTASQIMDANCAYLHVIRPFFDSISPQLTAALMDNKRACLWKLKFPSGHEQTARHQLAVDHLFCWATFVGNLDLARCLWTNSKRPIHMALLGAYICNHMEKAVYVDKQVLLERAAEMQSWAMSVMDMLPSEEVAHKTLMPKLSDHNFDDDTSLMELAMFLLMKRFLAQRHSLSLMEKLWLGRTPDSPCALAENHTSVLYLLFRVCLPILIIWERMVSGLHASDSKEHVAKTDERYKAVVMQSLARSLGQTSEQMAKMTSRGSGLDEEVTDEDRARWGLAPNIEREASFTHWNENMRKRSASHVVSGRFMTVRKTQRNHTDWDFKPLRFFTYLFAFYDVPKVKFVSHLLTYVGLVVILFIVTLSFKFDMSEMDEDAVSGRSLLAKGSSGGEQGVVRIDTDAEEQIFRKAPGISSWPEVVWFVYELALQIDQLYCSIKWKVLGMRRQKGHVQRFMMLLFVLAVGLRLASIYIAGDTGVYTYRAYQAIISVKMIFACYQMLGFMSQWRKIGVLHITFESMLGSMGPWLSLWLVFVIGFVAAFSGLNVGGFHRTKSDRQDDQWSSFADFAWPWGFDGLGNDAGLTSGIFDLPMMVPLWGTLAEFNPQNFDIVASVVLFVFIFMVNTVLVNMLIAIFSDEYAKVKNAADDEHALLRCREVFDYARVKTAAPPPFNLPIVMIHVLKYYWRRILYGEEHALHKNKEECLQISSGARVAPHAAKGEARRNFSEGSNLSEVDLAVSKFKAKLQETEESSPETMLTQLSKCHADATEFHGLKLMQVEERLMKVEATLNLLQQAVAPTQANARSGQT